MNAPQVYRAYDDAGRLLYVGCSVNVDSRLAHHEQHAPWWPFQVRIEREDFATRDAAADAEAAAIATEHPRWNMTGRSPDHPDGAAKNLHHAPWLAYERDVAKRLRRLRDEETSLLRKIRKVRMGLAGVNAEVAAIRSGFELDEDVA